MNGPNQRPLNSAAVHAKGQVDDLVRTFLVDAILEPTTRLKRHEEKEGKLVTPYKNNKL